MSVNRAAGAEAGALGGGAATTDERFQADFHSVGLYTSFDQAAINARHAVVEHSTLATLSGATIGAIIVSANAGRRHYLYSHYQAGQII